MFSKKITQKMMCILTALFLILGYSATAFAANEVKVKIKINGIEVNFYEAQPFIDNNGRVQVPMSTIAEAFGGVAYSEPSLKGGRIIRYDDMVSVVSGGKNVIKNKETVEMDTEAVMHNNVLYVPVRYIAEALGAEVKWIDENDTVEINMSFDDIALKLLKDENLKPLIGFNLDSPFDEYSIRNKFENAEQYIDGERVYRLADTKYDGLNFIIEENGARIITAVSVNEMGNFFGIKVGKDGLEKIIAVLGEPDKYEKANESALRTAYYYFGNTVLLVGINSNDKINRIAYTFKEADKKMTVEEAKKIFDDLLPQSMKIYIMFNGTGYFELDESQTIPDDTAYQLVVDENINSIAEIRKIIDKIFTKDAAERRFYTYFFTTPGSNALYRDYDDRLYQDSRNGGKGLGAVDWHTDTLTIRNFGNDLVEIEMDVFAWGEFSHRETILLKNVNGVWFFASSFSV